MWGQLHESAKVGWIGQAEESAADLSSDAFIMVSLAIAAVTIFTCFCLIVNLQLYQMLPGWGPIRKFDNDGTEEMRINQLLIHEEKQGGGHHMKGDKRNIDENVAFLQGFMTSAAGECKGLVDKAKTGQSLLGKGKNQMGLPDNMRSNVKDANEDADLEAEDADAKNGLFSGFQETYGSIGKCTWGYCESPSQWGETKMDPRYGEVVVRHGFADTQWMREHSKSWAKDEVYFQQVNQRQGPPLCLQDESAMLISQRMNIQRGGY